MAATTNYYLLSILLGCSLTTKTPGEAASVQTVVIKPNRSCFSLATFMSLSELPVFSPRAYIYAPIGTNRLKMMTG